MTKKRTNQPTSKKQIESNRRNAQSSSGPKSSGGKQRSAANALQHGLYAERSAAITRGLLAEDADEVDELVDACVRELDPHGPIQAGVARQIAVALLRVRRLEAYESLHLSAAGRLPSMIAGRAASDDELSQIERDAEALSKVLRALLHGEEVAAGDVEALRELAPIDGLLFEPAERKLSTEDPTKQLAELVDLVWLGDEAACASWCQSRVQAMDDRLDEIHAGFEYAAGQATDRLLDTITVVYGRVDSGLDRALARYAALRSSSPDEET